MANTHACRVTMPTLAIDGRVSGLRLRRARGFFSRLIGFWPSPRWHDVDAIEFPRCCSIHTLAMCAPLDIAFIGVDGTVLRLAQAVPAWRILREPAAAAVLEFPAGSAASHGLTRGARVAIADVNPAQIASHQSTRSQPNVTDLLGTEHPRRRERGSAMIEFILAAIIVLLPLVTGILELAQLSVARQVLAQATADAARSIAIHAMDAESASGGSTARGVRESSLELLAIRLSLARGMLPLQGGPVGDIDRWSASALATLRPDLYHVTLERGVLESPDVRVDLLRVTHCRDLFFAPASHFLPALMRLWTVDPVERLCLASGRVPLSVSAPATRSRFP